MKKLTIIALFALFALFALPALALFTDVNDKAYHGKTNIKDLTAAIDANFAQIEAGTWTITGGPTSTIAGIEGGDAALVIEADEGDDNADTFTFKVDAAANGLTVLNHTTSLITVATAGAVGMIADVTLTDADGAALLSAIGFEASDATLVLDADQGDDNADTWKITAAASDNSLAIINHTTSNLTIAATGAVGIIADLTLTDADGAALVSVIGFEASNASIVLDADQGDDNADTWTIASLAADNALSLKNHTTTVATFTAAGRLAMSAGAGAVAGTGAAAVEYGDATVHQTVITFTDTPITLADEAGVIAYGGLKVYDLPEGAILINGAVADINLTKSSAGVNDNWDGDISIGTATAANDADLTSTEADIVAKTATPQAAAGATTGDMVTATAQMAIFDGTAAAKDVFVNVLVDDADHDVNGTACNIILNGTITITWVNLGDK